MGKLNPRNRFNSAEDNIGFSSFANDVSREDQKLDIKPIEFSDEVIMSENDYGPPTLTISN
jgi:hypothetical protein